MHVTLLGFMLALAWLIVMLLFVALASGLTMVRDRTFYDRWVIPAIIGVCIAAGAVVLLFGFR